MSDTTANLALPLIAAAQAQKHVTHNEALVAIDTLLQCAVLDRDLAAPPAGVAEGSRYIVAAAATGDWAGRSELLATRLDGAWSFVSPSPGFVAYVVDEAVLCAFDGTRWALLTGTADILQNVRRLGIGTAADAGNPFSARLNGALWTALPVGEGGTGDLRYVLNKEAAGNVLSLLFQTAYSARFEFGLIGAGGPAFKVSPDGGSWATALTIDPATGGVDFLSAETALTSAATVDLGAAPTRRVALSGSGTVTSFGAAHNAERLLRFASPITLQHDATALALPGRANILAAAGDTALATSDAAGHWSVRHYQRVDGAPLAAPATQAKTAGWSVAPDDGGRVFLFAGMAAATVSLPAGTSTGSGFAIRVRNASAAVLTLAPAGSDPIEGSTLLSRQDATLLWDGSAWQVLGQQPRVLLASLVLSGASAQVVALPAGYAKFELDWQDLQASVAGAVTMRASQDGGSTYAGGASDYLASTLVPNGNNTVSASVNVAASSIAISGALAPTGSSVGRLEMQPGTGTTRPMLRTAAAYTDATLGQATLTASACRAATGRVTHLTLIPPGSGTMSGGLRLFGLR